LEIEKARFEELVRERCSDTNIKDVLTELSLRYKCPIDYPRFISDYFNRVTTLHGHFFTHKGMEKLTPGNPGGGGKLIG
jgi:hypothetical protein